MHWNSLDYGRMRSEALDCIGQRPNALRCVEMDSGRMLSDALDWSGLRSNALRCVGMVWTAVEYEQIDARVAFWRS